MPAARGAREAPWAPADARLRAPAAADATAQATTAPPVSRASVGYRIDFPALDGDRDGRINRAEAGGHAALTADFLLLDTDGDGYLSPRELEGRM